jgi:hypothetical protein
MKKKNKKNKNTDSIIPMGPTENSDKRTRKVLADHLPKKVKK